MKKLSKYLTLAFAIFFAAAALMFGGIASAQNTDAGTTAVQNGGIKITFPIAELGNCADKDACRAYCDDSAHIDACITFGKAHGLLNKDEADRSQKFKESIKGGKGPGGCDSPSSCRAYCSNVSHIDECVQFASLHGFKGIETQKGEKISRFIKAGGSLPGGCESVETCKAYCGEHGDECLEFAHKAGITVSTSSSASSISVAFSGKGPGGCDSLEACKAFCDEVSNYDTCFKFAADHALIAPEKLQEIKDSVLRMHEGISDLSDETKDCLASMLGSSTIDDLQSGKFTPSENAAQKMKGCFIAHGEQHDPKQAIISAPGSVKACVKEKLGIDIGDIASGKVMPTPEMADTFRMCFQALKMGDGEKEQGKPMNSVPSAKKVAEYIKNAPAPVSACLKEKLGDDLGLIGAGSTTLSQGTIDTIRGCFQSFMPNKGEMMNKDHGQRNGTSTKNFVPRPHTEGDEQEKMMDPSLEKCLKEKLGDEKFELLKTTRPDAATIELMRACMPQMNSGMNGMQNSGMPRMPENEGGTQNTQAPPWINRLPPQVLSCLKGKLGEEALAKAASLPPTGEIETAVEACFATLAPQSATQPNMQIQNPPPSMPAGTNTPPPGGGTMPKPQARGNALGNLLGAILAAFR